MSKEHTRGPKPKPILRFILIFSAGDTLDQVELLRQPVALCAT